MSAHICRLFLLALLLTPPVLSSAQSALVNINTAGSAELQTLDGVGPTYAQRIIDYRTANGSFQNIEEIKNVSGIGEVTFANIKDFITVGSTDSGDVNDSTGGDATTNTSSSTGSSAHYNASSLSDEEELSVLNLGAGRERIGTVGSPMEFKVETNIKNPTDAMFNWNFGDGGSGKGYVLSHAYEYPGDYIVVLRAATLQGDAVARTKVKIVDAEVSVVFANSQRIDIQNNSNSEISLFGRGLVVAGKVFEFPQDTLIGPGQKISFSANRTWLTPSRLEDVWLVATGERDNARNIVAHVEQKKTEKIASIQSELGVLQTKLAQLNHAAYIARQSQAPAEVFAAESEDNAEIKDLSQTASVSNAVPAIEEETGTISGWFSKLKRFFLGGE